MDEAKDVLTSIPAWGIFAFLVIKLVLDFLAKREEKAVKESASTAGFSKPPTSEEIAALIRDQQERQEIIETLRTVTVSQQQLAELLGKITSAEEKIAVAHDRSNQLLDRQAHRTRALIEAIAASRQTIERLAVTVGGIDQDQQLVMQHLNVRRQVTNSDRDEPTPVGIPIPPPHRTVG